MYCGLNGIKRLRREMLLVMQIAKIPAICFELWYLQHQFNQLLDLDAQLRLASH
jgi:hypothetical protein